MKWIRNMTMALAAVAMGNSLFAANMDDRVSNLERQMNCVYMEVVEPGCECEEVVRTCGALTGIASPLTVQGCGCGWFASLDALYWTVRFNGTEYAWRINQPSFDPDDPVFPLKGGIKDYDPIWDWGFRAGVGYSFEYDGWEAFAEFTYFDSNGSSTATSGSNSAIVPMRGTNIITLGDGFDVYSFAQTGKTKVEFGFRRLDVDLGRNFYVSPKLALNPSFGLTAVWVNMKQQTQYFGGDLDEGGLGVNTVHVKDSDYLKGIGPMIGFDTAWTLGWGFGFFADASASLLYGYHDIEHREKFSALSTNHIEISDSEHRFVPTALLEIGLSWHRYFDNDEKHVLVKLGFDTQYWWRMNQMVKIDDPIFLHFESYTEDIGIIGLNLSIRFDF